MSRLFEGGAVVGIALAAAEFAETSFSIPGVVGLLLLAAETAAEIGEDLTCFRWYCIDVTRIFVVAVGTAGGLIFCASTDTTCERLSSGADRDESALMAA